MYGSMPLGSSYTAPTKISFAYADGDLSVYKTFTSITTAT